MVKLITKEVALGSWYCHHSQMLLVDHPYHLLMVWYWPWHYICMKLFPFHWLFDFIFTSHSPATIISSGINIDSWVFGDFLSILEPLNGRSWLICKFTFHDELFGFISFTILELLINSFIYKFYLCSLYFPVICDCSIFVPSSFVYVLQILVTQSL